MQGYRATRSASATKTDTPIREIPQAISVVPALSTAPQVGLFANASTSFKPNNGLDRNGGSFDPEEGVGYEAGVKLDLLDDRRSASLAAFHLAKENVLSVDPLDLALQIAAG